MRNALFISTMTMLVLTICGAVLGSPSPSLWKYLQTWGILVLLAERFITERNEDS